MHTAQSALSHACFLITYPIAGWIGAADLALAAVLTLIASLAAGFAITRTRKVTPA